jgi:heme-degrading monooxygenase HmoA
VTDAPEHPHGAGPVVTVFRSRLRPEARDEYGEWADRMLELARAMPGFVEFKAFEAQDGERVSVITFANLDAQRAWRDHPEHRVAQRLGRDRFYESYAIQVCEVLGETGFTR